ncbi:MAG: M14 family metallopeptidase [Candidatus Aminicenantales bacterium]
MATVCRYGFYRFPVYAILVLVLSVANGAAELTFDRYHTPAERADAIREMARANPGVARLHTLTKSPGGRDLVVLEVGPETGKAEKAYPAVFVAADMEGTVPISGEAALYLAKLVLEKPELRTDRTWYILPCGNPDAAARFFDKPLQRCPRNAAPVNDDRDDRTDEDGADDLDRDGFITQMRVKDPAGEWIPVPGEPRLLKKADWTKGEKGIYKFYPEGLDNDGDGEINEDGPGGVNIGITFPHLFKYFTPAGGLWPGSEKETFALLKFFDEHREVGLTFVFGETNFCLSPPRGGRKGEADLNQIKIPENIAGFINADPEKTYTMAEIMDLVKPMAPPGMELSEAMIASFLGLGAVVNPLDDDLKFYKELSEKYKEFLKTNKLDSERLDPAQDKDGSFELWSYYHLGLPSFALDFWTPPKVKEEKPADEITPEKLEKMTNEEFIALGEEKVDAFLKSAGAPGQFKAKQIFEALKGGMMDTRKMAEMMRQMPKPPAEGGADPREKALLAWSDKELEGKGFVEWKTFRHPTLGEVEIGGFVPFTDNSPPPRMIEGLLKGQVPWVFEISKKMARIRISEVKVEPLGAGVYEVKLWVENTGMLPYPTAMGQRNQRILPVIVSLGGDGFRIIEGKARSPIASIPGLSAKEVTWIVQAEKAVKIEVKAETRCAGSDTRTIALGGAK